MTTTTLDTTIVYFCEGEQSFMGPLKNITENFAESGDESVGPTVVAEIIEAVESGRFYIGTHGCGRYVILPKETWI